MKTLFKQKCKILLASVSLLLTSSISIADNSVDTVATNSCINIKKTGKGPIVFLIPGFSNDSRVWQETSRFIEKNHQVHNISISGFGANPSCKFNTQIYDTVVQQISQYALSNKFKQVSVVGHSMGGLIAMNLGKNHPAVFTNIMSVDGLPFIGPVFTRSNSTTPNDLLAQAKNMKQFYEASTIEQIRLATLQAAGMYTVNKNKHSIIADMAAESDSVTLGNAIFSAMTTDLRNELHKITGNLTLIGAPGGADNKAYRVVMENLYREQLVAKPDAKLVFHDSARHFVMYEDVDWLNNQIQDFLLNKGR
jgi:N-formylmaleamate deformylase